MFEVHDPHTAARIRGKAWTCSSQAMPRTPIRARHALATPRVTFGVTPGCADGCVDAPAQPCTAAAVVLDLRRAVQHRQDAPPRQGREGVRLARSPAAIMFALSPVHTDDVLRRQGRQAVRLARHRHHAAVRHRPACSRRSACKTLLPAIVAKSRGKPIEFHSNNMLGQSAKAYLDAVDLGVTHPAHRERGRWRTVRRCPSIEIMVHNIELLGHTHNIDTTPAHAGRRPLREGRQGGGLPRQPVRRVRRALDPAPDAGRHDRHAASAARKHGHDRPPRRRARARPRVVRKELGYPGMATPFCAARRHPGGAQHRDRASATRRCRTR